MKMRALSCLLGLMISSGSALAADMSQPPATPVANTSDWRFQATIYGWASGVQGYTGVAGRGPVQIDVTPWDAIQDLRGAAMASFGGSSGNWMFLTDFMYTNVGSDGVAVKGLVNYSYDQTQYTVQGIVGYQLPLNAKNFQMSATAGFRYQNLSADLGLGSVLTPVTYQDGGTKQWIDPTVGIYTHYDFDEHWFTTVLGDVGGFGVGADFSWQLFGAVGYNWNKNISTSLGYRAIYEDYRSGGFVYDTTQQGVFAGVGIHF